MNGFLYLYMSLLTDEIDKWDLPEWVLESGEPLWLDIKNFIMKYAYDDITGLSPLFYITYGLLTPDKNYINMHRLSVQSRRGDKGTPDVNLTTRYIYNRLKGMYPDETIIVK